VLSKRARWKIDIPNSFDARASVYRRNWYRTQTTAASSAPLSNLLITDSGAQPLVNEAGTVFLAVNGEIYNHRILRKKLKGTPKFKTHSDCEVILHLVLLARRHIPVIETEGLMI